MCLDTNSDTKKLPVCRPLGHVPVLWHNHMLADASAVLFVWLQLGELFPSGDSVDEIALLRDSYESIIKLIIN